MALPRGPTSSWLQNLDVPSGLFETGRRDYELYEEDEGFVLSVEMPDFDPEETTASWDDGVLNVATEPEDDHGEQRRTYHRRFRFHKGVDEDGIEAEYTTDILTVRLPLDPDATGGGTEIEVQA